MAQALSDIDEPIKEVDKIAKALGSLPMKYCGFITAWDSYDETKQTYDNLVARLLKEEKRLTEVEEATVAFASLNAGKTSKAATNQKERNTDKRNIECFFCKKKGHYKSECRKRQNKQQSSNEDKNKKHQALSVEYKNVEVNSSEEEWLGDSAASKHMSHRRDWFTTFHTGGAGNNSVQIRDNSQIEVEGYGDIKVLALVNGEWEPRTIENVLYVPKLKKNLFSVGATTNKNLKAIFCKDKMEIYSDRLVAVGIKQSNHCYKMLFKTVTETTANVSTVDSALPWHERLGHINFQALKEMADQGLLAGTQINTIKGLFCEACQRGKLHRLPFQKRPREKVSKPGEYLHMDLCGKMSHSSIGGANYYILFKDDSTSYRIIHFIKHKSDAFSKFLEAQKLIERQTGNLVKKGEE